MATASDADRTVDVAIVGAGYTGLWTAYYLKQADPDIRVAVVESEIAGFGASGRNGGWCSALYPASLSTLAREHGREGAVAQYRALQASVAEVGRVATVEGFDIDFAQGGMVDLARSAPQMQRARDMLAEVRAFGFGPEDARLLDADGARARLNASSVVGAFTTPHCAALHPAKLVRSLARRVEQLGIGLYEKTKVVAVSPGIVQTEHGELRAHTVVRATEAFTARLPAQHRRLVPVYSLMIATEPLPDSVWADIGLEQRETFADLRHVIIYGQRTADGRMVFGGRGAPYHWGSRIRPAYDRAPRVFDMLRTTLVDLVPQLAGARITHRWGGPLGIARDWHPSVGLDRSTGLAWAGGYVGDGVATSNLAGRTLTDLVLGRDSELVRLPWVDHRSPDWPTEPLRWLGANLGLNAMRWADRAEARTGRSSRLAPAVNRVLAR